MDMDRKIGGIGKGCNRPSRYKVNADRIELYGLCNFGPPR